MAEGSAAFTSPTIVHFAAVLLLSAVMSVPWGGHGIVAGLWGLISLAGIAYTLIVMRRMRTQHAYDPSSRLAHSRIPAARLLCAPGGCRYHGTRAPARREFRRGGVTLVLLFTSIHNAWTPPRITSSPSPRRRQAGTGAEPTIGQPSG